MKSLIYPRIVHLLMLFPLAASPAQLPDGNATIRAAAGPSEIVITTTARLAGAIHSLTWNGREFIDSTDHGRQFQSASNLDCGMPITGETFNPTEAGSARDGVGDKSSGRVLFVRAAGHALQTVSQMAFWLAPGEKSGPNLAKNTTILSDHLLTKRVQIGYKNRPHVISCQLFARSNLASWCIVPFDAKKRGSEERAQMLEQLGIKKFAYDWRAEHIPTFDAEVAALKRHGVELTAWWTTSASRAARGKSAARRQSARKRRDLPFSTGPVICATSCAAAHSVRTAGARPILSSCSS